MPDGSKKAGLDVDPARRGWLEIWSCFPSVDHGQRWFVDHCTHDGKRTVADCPTASDADAAAALHGLPIIYIQA